MSETNDMVQVDPKAGTVRAMADIEEIGRLRSDLARVTGERDAQKAIAVNALSARVDALKREEAATVRAEQAESKEQGLRVALREATARAEQAEARADDWQGMYRVAADRAAGLEDALVEVRRCKQLRDCCQCHEMIDSALARHGGKVLARGWWHPISVPSGLATQEGMVHSVRVFNSDVPCIVIATGERSGT